MALQYNLVRFADGFSSVTAFINSQMYTTDSSNRLWDTIVEKLKTGDESVVDQFDLANLANKAFHAVTDKVNVRNGKVFMNGAEVDSRMATVLLDYLHEGNENLMPLVRFLERLDENPSFHSRNQFWDFVENHGIHIDDDGYVIMYKGVLTTDTPGTYKSSASGRAFVNGQEQNGQIHTAVGDVVTMPRREISDDPGVACHAGLHCGARSYAENFARILISVRVDPRHVVSVPSDYSNAKVRVEQYEIMDVVNDIHTGVRWDAEAARQSEWDDYDY